MEIGTEIESECVAIIRMTNFWQGASLRARCSLCLDTRRAEDCPPYRSAVRRGIFVEPQSKHNFSSVGAAYSDPCRRPPKDIPAGCPYLNHSKNPFPVRTRGFDRFWPVFAPKRCRRLISRRVKMIFRRGEMKFRCVETKFPHGEMLGRRVDSKFRCRDRQFRCVKLPSRCGDRGFRCIEMESRCHDTKFRCIKLPSRYGDRRFRYVKRP